MSTPKTRRPAMVPPVPKGCAPGGAQDTQQATHASASTVDPPAGADTRPTKDAALPRVHTSGGAQPKRKKARAETSDRTLAFAANVVDDLEVVRIAMQNRLRALTRGGPADERITKGKAKSVEDLEPDKDGEERGWALEADDPDVLLLADVVDNLLKIEDRVVKALERKMRDHRLGPWVAAHKGCGDKQVARLLGAIGDPYWRPELTHDDGTTTPAGPRTVAALRRYCGLDPVPAADQGLPDDQSLNVGGDGTGDPGQSPYDTQISTARVARRRIKGKRAKWSHKARKNAWLIVTSCKKQVAGKTAGTCIVDDDERIKHADGCACSPYRVLYDDARRKYDNAIHDHDCAQCKRKAGEPLTAGHQEGRAMRLVSKEILKDLWREAKRLHEAAQSP
jgi:hypothetical protein